MKSPRIFRTAPMLSPLLLTLLILPLALAGCGEDQAPKTDTRSADRPAPVTDAAPKPAPPPAEHAVAPETTSPTLPATPKPTSVPSTPAAVNKAAAAPTAPRIKYKSGEDPEFAKNCGWPVNCPAPLPGAILPQKRIVAYYGNPNSRRMGALGEYEKDEMLRRLKGEAERWEQADPSLPVQPALHLIAVVAQDQPGKAGKYRMIMPDEVVNRVYGWAKEANAVMFIDIQTGHDDIRAILPRFEWILKNPDVHLGIDPEFNLIKSGKIPGTKIGTYDAADINYVSGYLAELVQKYNLPPKVFTVHRFTRNGVTNSRNIQLRPEVQIVMHMDGWGAPWLKRDSYKDYVVAEPVQYTGFKLFYHNDTKKGDPLMTPEDVLKLHPKPLYIQYQ
ncbi:MAG TPA: hypothetical protein VD811_08815 [Desulfuromonadales bacterium]|nr:hypothetical protein [Desulfuromonadales bacterium]